MQTKTTKNGTEYLTEPLTADELDAIADEDGGITVCVPVLLDDVANTDYEGYLDLLERCVIKDYCGSLMDICISTVDVDEGQVIVKVSADYDTWH